MNRSQRRRFERELQGLLARDGDHCSICGAELEHNTRTHYGVTRTGAAAMAGPCCRAKLTEIMGEGLYIDAHAGDLLDAAEARARQSKGRPPATAAELSRAVDGLQAAVSASDAMAKDLLDRAGLDGRGSVTVKPTAWKADDAAWFAARPDRAHRLRPLFEDELPSLGGAPSVIPPGHEVEVLVRQIEPGKRVRVQFRRNVEVPIPDDEAVIHALFDLAAQGDEGAPIKAEAVRDLAVRYNPKASGGRPQ